MSRQSVRYQRPTTGTPRQRAIWDHKLKMYERAARKADHAADALWIANEALRKAQLAFQRVNTNFPEYAR